MNKTKSSYVTIKSSGLLSPIGRALTPMKSSRMLAAMMAMAIALPLWLRPGLAQTAPPEPYLVKDINADTSGSYPGGLIYVNGTLFFSANDGSSGVELWKSDGTAVGTTIVKDISPGSRDSYPHFMTDVGGTLFFWANMAAAGLSCGRATARRWARSWSKTSTRGAWGRIQAF